MMLQNIKGCRRALWEDSRRGDRGINNVTMF